ncbi:MAG: aminopeptidase [Eubacteriales bacterium]
MTDYRQLYKEENNSVLSRYQNMINQVSAIVRETEPERPEKPAFRHYFNRVGNFIKMLVDLEKVLDVNYFEEQSFQELEKKNNDIYEDLIADRYLYSYANPKNCVKIFGKEFGRIMSFLYVEVRSCIVDAYEHRLYYLTIYGELFVKVYDYITSTDDIKEEEMIEIIYNFYMEYLPYMIEQRTREVFNPALSFAKDIIMESDLKDIKYLFKYGEYISNNEIKIAEYLNRLPQETIDLMAKTYTNAYIRGFERDNIDLSKKKTVNIRYPIGFERVIRSAINNFRQIDLEPIMYRYAVKSINKRQNLRIGYFATSPNKQFDYDHRFDNALYLNQAFADMKASVTKQVFEKNKDKIKEVAGPAVLETFGEKPFSPKNKEEALRLNEQQQKINTELTNKLQQITYQYMPGEEISFTIIAFPIPEIGDQFENIFKDIIKVNTLNNQDYEHIQQIIINTLDDVDYVHVKGKDGNHTDIVVKLANIVDKEKETTFENCVADVNVPVGEVFTTPVLEDTHGVLHVKEVYLRDLKYENLTLRFKNGYIEEYTCSNFDNEEDNKRYIKENLMYNYESLPIGEFAIGTNTMAYVMAYKYNIIDILPILIVEKMGPHFAVGDTCYSRSEEQPKYNFDGKEIVAKDNSKSIKRKEDISDAYFNCHTDITIPYDSIGGIAGIKKDGTRVDIIKDGRFVLKGTERLNEPFNE